MRQQVVGFCELYMLVMGSWSVMGGSTLLAKFLYFTKFTYNEYISKSSFENIFKKPYGYKYQNIVGST